VAPARRRRDLLSPVLAQLSSALPSSEQRPLPASSWLRRPWLLLLAAVFSFRLQVSNLQDPLLPASSCLLSLVISLIPRVSVAILPMMPFISPIFHHLPFVVAREWLLHFYQRSTAWCPPFQNLNSLTSNSRFHLSCLLVFSMPSPFSLA